MKNLWVMSPSIFFFFFYIVLWFWIPETHTIILGVLISKLDLLITRQVTPPPSKNGTYADNEFIRLCKCYIIVITPAVYQCKDNYYITL